MVSLSCIWSGSCEANVKIQKKCIGKNVHTFTTVYILSYHIMNNNDSIRSCHHLLNELQPCPPDDSVSSCCQSSDWESSTSSLPLRPQEPAQSPSTVPETEHTHYDRWINFRWYQLIYIIIIDILLNYDLYDIRKQMPGNQRLNRTMLEDSFWVCLF